jgi:superfamily II DNA helicase RecQ
MKFSEFQRDIRIIKTSIDRLEIYFQVSCLKKSQKSMLNLQHILPERVTCADDISKTIIYMNSIQSICDACDLFRVWMKGLKYFEDASKWVAPFFADMAKNDKRRLCHQFAKVTSECFAPRILIATDSYGLGIDNPDVQLVVQWLVPSSIQKLYQRMGRAMRFGRKQARFLFLHSV